MAVSINYVARETATNLRRNVAMSIAAVLTVSVSLALVGSALLMRQGVNKANLQWRGGVELSIFMRPDAPQGQIDAVKRELDATPEVKSARFVDKQEALDEYKKIFADNDDIRDIITDKAEMPTSFRVVPTHAELADTIGRRFKTRAGVESVAFASKEVDALLKTTRQRQVAYFGVALVLLVGAVLLIFNAIQLAVLNRRREIEVMKLVGATNWFIRLPFMLEGLLQGLFGGLVAAVLVYVFRGPIFEVVSDPAITQSLRKIHATAAEARNTGIVLMLTGAGVGALSSALAVRRHLRV
jgi:cell division transport system permease protein